jgi:hypothetical protein
MVGCVGGSPRTPPTTSAGATGPGAATPLPSSSVPLRLEQLILTADLGERPASWDLVARLAFGAGRGQLGLDDDPERTPIPHFAPSLAVGSDGSLWLLDEVKRRIAHLSATGAYLGEVGDISYDRFHPHVQDIAVVGSDLLILEVDHSQHPPNLVSSVGIFPPSGEAMPWTALTSRGHQVVADHLIQGVQTPMAQLHGFADLSVGGPAGYATVDRAGIVSSSPGIPVGSGRWMDLEDALDAGEPNATEQDFDLILTGSDARRVLPIRIRLLAHPGARTASVPAIVGVEAISAISHGIVAYVQVSPSRPRDAVRFGGGHWLLKLSDDGSPIWWERLAEPGLSSEVQVRHLAVGADGSVYRMVAEPDALDIYRRPGS